MLQASAECLGVFILVCLLGLVADSVTMFCWKLHEVIIFSADATIYGRIERIVCAGVMMIIYSAPASH